MRFITILKYDIKRLVGRGRNLAVTILSPLAFLFIFVIFLIPMLTDNGDMTISCALLQEDQDENFCRLINTILAVEESRGIARIYPVKDEETGLKLVKEGKVAVFLHIYPETYSRLMNEEAVDMDFYYNQIHAMDASLFARALRSTSSIFGQGLRMVRLGADMAMEHGVQESTVIDKWSDGMSDVLALTVGRGKILGYTAIFAPGGDFPTAYLMGLVLMICGLISTFPGVYLTSKDVNVIYSQRKLRRTEVTRFFLARLVSQALLLMVNFLMVFPFAKYINETELKSVMLSIPAMLLVAFTFSAMAILVGALSRNPNDALWVEFYISLFMIVLAICAGREGMLGDVLQKVAGFLPAKAAISLFANGLFELQMHRYLHDISILAVALLIFLVPAYCIFRKRGCSL